MDHSSPSSSSPSSTDPDVPILANDDEFKPRKNFKMKGKIKKFNQRLFEKYDTPARNIIKEKLGDKVRDNPDIYAEDMIIDDPECRFKYIELQACAEWIYDKYPYAYPYVFERKASFSDDTLFIIFNYDMSKGLMFAKTALNKTPKRQKKFSRVFVYDVPWYNVVEFYTEYFTMDNIYLY